MRTAKCDARNKAGGDISGGSSAVKRVAARGEFLGIELRVSASRVHLRASQRKISSCELGWPNVKNDGALLSRALNGTGTLKLLKSDRLEFPKNVSSTVPAIDTLRQDDSFRRLNYRHSRGERVTNNWVAASDSPRRILVPADNCARLNIKSIFNNVSLKWLF